MSYGLPDEPKWVTRMKPVAKRTWTRVAKNPLPYAGGTVAAGVFGGGTIFSFVESGASMPDGWWWAFVSMSTVGYGDISPATPFMRFLAFFVISAGIIGTVILTGALAGAIAKWQIVRALEAKATVEKDDDIQAVAAELRDHADALDVIAPEMRALYESRDRACRLGQRIRAHMGDPLMEDFEGGACYTKREVLKLCGELEGLAGDAGQRRQDEEDVSNGSRSRTGARASR